MDRVSNPSRYRLCLIGSDGLSPQLRIYYATDFILQPIVGVQRDLPKALVPMGTTMVVFSQAFGLSVFLAIAQAVFNGSLRSEFAAQAPTVDVDTIIAVGATGIRGAVSPDQLDSVLNAYNSAVTKVFVSILCHGVTAPADFRS